MYKGYLLQPVVKRGRKASDEEIGYTRQWTIERETVLMRELAGLGPVITYAAKLSPSCLDNYRNYVLKQHLARACRFTQDISKRVFT